jgi:hypothetical protein
MGGSQNKELKTVWQRFETRLHLHQLGAAAGAATGAATGAADGAGSEWKAQCLDIQKIDSKAPFLNQKMELYHSVRESESFDDKRIQSILKHGFRVPYSSFANKGNGVYLSNHSRYAWNWGGPVVIVCHVDATCKSIQRFRSELRSGNDNGWEYVVKDPKCVQPKYLIRYAVQGKLSEENRKKHIGWVPHTDTGCPKCTQLPKRCDCPLFPTVDPNDLV